MSAQDVSLKHVLTRHEVVAPNLFGMQTDELKRAVRFWFGTTASNKFRKSECVDALTKLFQDGKRLAEGVRALPEKQRQVLAICKRYGGTMSGALLLAEVLARGLVQKPKPSERIYGRPRAEDPVSDLFATLILLPQYGSYDRYSSFSAHYRLNYPDVVVPAALLDGIESAPSLPWPTSARVSPPAAPFQRPAALFALELETTARALAQAGTWKTNRGGSLVKSMQNRLQKLSARPHGDPLDPPDPEALDYEILRGLGAVQIEEDQGRLDLASVESDLRDPAPVQAWHWVRAWMQARLWQDGIGVVPDRDNYENPVRIQPEKLRKARELVVWSLCRVAHSAEDWLDLETFLIDLYSAAGEDGFDFYWHGYAWNPEFKQAEEKENIHEHDARRRAYWLDSAGTWVANVIMGTLAHLGLVERGTTGSQRNPRDCFRLTGLGKAVFGAPEIAMPETSRDTKFLTIQPNYEIQAYLDVADASAVWPLAQIARRASSTSGLVQTFVLTRESIYQALESGLKEEDIRHFLQQHSRTGLPENVARSLTEWGRKREALSLRTGVTLGAYPVEQAERFSGVGKERRIGDQFVLLPKTAARGVKSLVVRDQKNRPTPSWRVEETGRIRVGKESDAVALARLGQFADPIDDEWRITAASVRRARERGIPAEQILGWLHAHLENELPAIVETALRNWSNPIRVFFGNLLLLQVAQPQACAMVLASERFRPLFLSHIPPDWFVVRPEKHEEMSQLLSEMGFVVGSVPKPTELPEPDADSDDQPTPRSGSRPRRKK